jgi:hypothetical protein
LSMWLGNAIKCMMQNSLITWLCIRVFRSKIQIQIWWIINSEHSKCI